jgi:lipopolysaccharide transport system ATP-binding protein
VTARPAAIELTDLSKRFRLMRDRRTTLKELVVRGKARQVNDFWAVRDVSLAIPKGSVFGLVGHNGSGKSTLLKLVAGIYRPTNGAVAVDGRLAALIELGAGFHPDLTGRENVRLNGSILGLTRREIDLAIGEIIDFSGLADFIDEPVKNYSSGMYVRLGFSVAVHMRPDVLLVDEVIAVGDEDFQRRCFDHLYGLRRAGKTIVIVSHATALLSSMCDEVAWLDHGRLMSTGPASSVIDGYIGSVNAVEGAARSTGRDEADPASARPGSGQVRLASVEVIGPDGGPAASCISGEPVRLRIAYQANEPSDGAVFTVSFVHESGVVVTVDSTHGEPSTAEVAQGRGRFDYVQDHCRLNPGNFRVDVAVRDSSGTHVFDDWTGSLDLVVRPGAEQNVTRGGLVRLPGRFEGASGPGSLVDRHGERVGEPRTQ